MRSHRMIRLLAIPALLAGMAAPAFAQTSNDQNALSSVDVQPVNNNPNDAGNGQWFIENLSPGQTARPTARFSNPLGVAQEVRVYLADVTFSSNGTPQIASEPGLHDAGLSGGFDGQTVTVPPRAAVDVPFTVAVGAGADPGDHLGAVVAETAPSASNGSTFKLVRRVARRLYITVPGEATPAYTVDRVTLHKDSSFFTKKVTVSAWLHNTGRVALRPTVKINGQVAKGLTVLRTKDVDQYVATLNVPIYGGPLSYNVDVQTLIGEKRGPSGDQAGPVREASASMFVIPYVLVIGLVLLVGFFFLLRWLWRKRGGKYAAIQADLRRFERLLDQQRATGEVTADTSHEAELAIKAAIKQAGRAGDKDTEIKLRGKLAELREQEAAPSPPPPASPPAPTSPAPAAAGSSPQPASVVAEAPEPANGNGNGNGTATAETRDDAPSLTAILRVLATAPAGGQRFALIKAARHYGRDAIEAHAEELAALPEDVRVRLLRAAPQQPEPAGVAPSEIA